jgi:hypothetical protein
VLVPGFSGAAHDVAPTEILEVIGKGGQRRDDVIDIGDVLFPLRLLVRSQRELLQVDRGCHDATTFLPASRSTIVNGLPFARFDYSEMIAKSTK